MESHLLTSKQFHSLRAEYRPDIDGLRGIAVISVLIFHAFPGFLSGGFIGIDVFFVISGYLISTIIFLKLSDGGFRLVDFYSRRIVRLFPSLLIVLIFCFAFAWFTLLPIEYKLLGKHITASAAFISNFVFWSEAGYFDVSSHLKPLLHLWSLGIEEQFYIVWPLILLVSWKFKLNQTLVICFFCLTSFILSINLIIQDPVSAFYFPHTRAWELLLGGLLAWMTLKRQYNFSNIVKRERKHFLPFTDYNKNEVYKLRLPLNFISVVGFSLLIYAFFIFNEEMHPGVVALVAVWGTFLIILASSKAWINRVILSSKVLVNIGLISYPLYLWHWPLLSFVEILDIAPKNFFVQTVTILLSFALAFLTYKFVERPIRSKEIKKTTVLTLIIIMIVIGFLGYKTYSEDGLKDRFPKEMQSMLTDAEYNWMSDVRSEKCLIDSGKKIKVDKKCYFDNSLVLWGDSHAASLYPGLEAFGLLNDVNISQFTIVGCPTIFELKDFFQPNCNTANEQVISTMKEISPRVILIHSIWLTKEFYWKDLKQIENKIRSTFVKLKVLFPNAKIVIVGSVPIWKINPQRTAYNYFIQERRTKPIQVIKMPERLKARVHIDDDKLLKNITTDLDLTYISPADYFCIENESQISLFANCLYKVLPTSKEYISKDNGHLSKSASIFFIKSVSNILEDVLRD